MILDEDRQNCFVLLAARSRSKLRTSLPHTHSLLSTPVPSLFHKGNLEMELAVSRDGGLRFSRPFRSSLGYAKFLPSNPMPGRFDSGTLWTNAQFIPSKGTTSARAHGTLNLVLPSQLASRILRQMYSLTRCPPPLHYLSHQTARRSACTMVRTRAGAQGSRRTRAVWARRRWSLTVSRLSHR